MLTFFAYLANKVFIFYFFLTILVLKRQYKARKSAQI